ncbi:hypothetical protein Dsin_012015 [Dipteronia sinensis]|uniref:Uncharacterized protein n=1 Tax=Dipteronia sinensis TaxID=43782 RepID=A0AAE0AHW3_9ROSI|nr:hypothetical protein Dsin_012015 [Dipteronia sinensis]
MSNESSTSEPSFSQTTSASKDEVGGGFEADSAESPEYIDVEEPSGSGRPLDILAGDNPGSVLTEDYMDSIRMLYRIQENVVLRAPKEHERVDWDIPGWTCFYEYNFCQGFRFPIPSLARRLLEYYDIAPGQLMPNS